MSISSVSRRIAGAQKIGKGADTVEAVIQAVRSRDLKSGKTLHDLSDFAAKSPYQDCTKCLQRVSISFNYVNMTDINAQASLARSPPSGAGTRQGIDPAAIVAPGDLTSFAELLFFAYRDFTADADAVLVDYGFGRAHHRVLHFVARSPGRRVADLLKILNITKQSLARVLKQLVDEDFVIQEAGKLDRRERLLFPTPKGAGLAGKLAELQARRIARALSDAGPQASAIVQSFLFGMIEPCERDSVEALLATSKERSPAAGAPEEE